MTREASAIQYFGGAFRERAIELIRFSASIKRTQAQMHQRANAKGGWANKTLPSGAELARMQDAGDPIARIAARFGVAYATVWHRIQAHHKAVEAGKV